MRPEVPGWYGMRVETGEERMVELLADGRVQLHDGVPGSTAPVTDVAGHAVHWTGPLDPPE